MKLTKSKIFLIFLLFFIAGVALRSFMEITIFSAYLAVLAGLVLAAVFWHNRHARILGLGGIFLFLGIWRMTISSPELTPQRIEYYNGQIITFKGILKEEPDIRKNHTKLTLAVKSLLKKGEQALGPPQGKVLISVPLYPEYNFGDELLVTCRLKQPEPIEDFHYEQYLARYHIYSLCYYPKEIKVLKTNQGHPLLAKIFYTKKKFVSLINRLLPEPQASFLGGLLYGARRSIPDDLTEAFNRTGTTHIIAISGYNITVLAVISQKFLQGIYISRKKAFWLTLGMIIFFVIITGAPASVVRAAIMGVLVLLAGQMGRANKIFNALVFTAALMLVINPKILRYDVGWQLSFLATMGLIYFSPLLVEKFFKKLPEYLGLKEALTSTLAAIIFTLPVILYNFGRLSVVAPIVNMLILPVIPWAMGAGFLSVAAAALWFSLGQIISWLAWFLLTYIIQMVKIFAGLPWAAWQTGSAWPVFLLYLPLLYFSKIKLKR